VVWWFFFHASSSCLEYEELIYAVKCNNIKIIPSGDRLSVLPKLVSGLELAFFPIYRALFLSRFNYAPAFIRVLTIVQARTVLIRSLPFGTAVSTSAPVFVAPDLNVAATNMTFHVRQRWSKEFSDSGASFWALHFVILITHLPHL
jgi:hypothetical protein